MIKHDEGKKVMREVYEQGKKRCWCDNCSKEIDPIYKAKKFHVGPDVMFDGVDFCDFDCMREWVGGDSKERKNLQYSLTHQEDGTGEIYLTLNGLEELSELLDY